MASKYNVGDMVRILDPVPDDSWVGTTPYMKEQAGKITTIANIINEANGADGYIYKLHNMHHWSWESNMFEPAVVFELNAEDDAVGTALFGQFFDAFKVI